MTRVLGFLVLMVAMLAGTATALAEPCPAIAIVAGPQPLRELMLAELSHRALETSPRGDCPQILVRMAAEEAGLVVSITDLVGRVSERHVADVATAASLVESWARPELDATLLSVRRPEVATQTDEREQPFVVRQPPVTPTLHSPAIHLAFDANSAVGSDGSLWVGASGLGCVQFGPACIGMMARVSRDSAVRGDSETLDTARRAVDLMLVLDLPHVHQTWSWTTGVQVGLAFNRSTYAPEIAGSSVMGDVEVDGGGLRAGAHIAVSKRLGGHWALGIDVAVDAAVIAPADPIDPEVGRIAGQPRGFLRGGLQLRYEGP